MQARYPSIPARELEITPASNALRAGMYHNYRPRGPFTE